ncbi:Rap1 GTPase-activating protein 2, partial [Modicella reniformis]
MYHVSTLLPHNTDDRQQIQRKRHIGNDIVCIIFVDGDQPIIPNAIRSQFLHIFVVIHPVPLPDGTTGYAATIVCDEQVPEFGPPLPDPPIFKTPQELRAFLLCKMINGENAACKAPRLIKPHQRVRSGMLENLVAKANTLTKEKDSDKKLAKQQKAMAAAAAHSHSAVSTPGSSSYSTSQSSAANINTPSTILPMAPHQWHHPHECQSHQCHPGVHENDGYFRCCTAPPASPSMSVIDDHYLHATNNRKAGGSPGHWTTAASIFRTRRVSSTADFPKLDSKLIAGKEKENRDMSGTTSPDHLHAVPTHSQQRDCSQDGPEHIESLISPTSHPLPPHIQTLASAAIVGETNHIDASMTIEKDMFTVEPSGNSSRD